MSYFGIPIRNGLPLGLGSVAGFGSREFLPADLFLPGTAGTWYDPSDPTTLFTTSAGTTPCAVPGSGSQVLVGLMLDKSQGAPGALGANVATTPYTGTTTGAWTFGTDIRRNGTTTQPATVSSVAGMTAAGTYRFTFTVADFSGDGFTLAANGASLNVGQITGNGAKSFIATIPASASPSLQFIPWAGTAGQATITNLSVQSIPGNHAIAFNDTTARPELSARVNLLTYSEEFENAAWQKLSGTVVSNQAIAPDGTTTAELLYPTTTGTFRGLYQTFTALAASYTTSVYAKAAGLSALGLTDLAGSTAAARFDLTSGTVGFTAAGYTASIQSVGNGWYRCSVTGLASAGLQYTYAYACDSALTNNATTSGTSGIFIWGADLRPANIGSAIPSYQRIADQYTYDSNGFPSYLRFDGVDDSMYTPASINFSGTDKMSVFAGVRKLSDAALGVVTELSSSLNSNNGVFWVMSGDGTVSAGPQWQFASKGTVNAFATSPSSYAAPITTVVSGIGDVGAPSVILRANGAQVGSSTSSQGTGNFGTYPLYIGSRNNASFRFNGHLYSLITAGTQLQSGSIEATEQYVAGKTGITI